MTQPVTFLQDPFLCLFADPCSKRDCEHYSRCTFPDYTESECVCPKMSECPSTKDEVCGSDGKTYPNDCALRVEACAKGEDISVANLGPCGKFMAFLFRICISLFITTICLLCCNRHRILYHGHSRNNTHTLKQPGILSSTDLTTIQ